jgi:AraC-like DNA-binding protein
MSGSSGIRYRERRAAPGLRRLVECLWVAAASRRRADRPPEHIVPDACPELILHLGDPFSRRVGTRWMRQPRVFLAGTLSRPWALRAGPRVLTLGVRFRPGAVTALLPLNMKEVVDREVELARLVGARESRELLRSLRAARGAEARFGVLERWLSSRRTADGERGGEVTRPAVEAILRARGQSRIDAVAAGVGVSPRRLERAFARDLGIRPKLFARIVRLNAALARLGASERAQAVDVALEAGYFDQAHLARDFRAVAGRRAAADRGRDGEMSRHFTDPARLLAFLAGE